MGNPEGPHGSPADQRGLLAALLGDGRPLLSFTGLSLILSGGFALFLALTRQFLPHDIQFLHMNADELCALHDCRIVAFMVHDRAAFGGALIAIGVLYLWLVEFPLRQGQAWSWWLFVISGVSGFSSFLAYLGYGYLDTWHGAATLLLLPIFLFGLVRSFRILPSNHPNITSRPSGKGSEESSPIVSRSDPFPEGRNQGLIFRRLPSLGELRMFVRPVLPFTAKSPFDLGRIGFLLIGLAMMVAGLVILTIGTTAVFMSEDLLFMELTPADLNAINPRLIPLIAHDRAGFGGAILTTGVTVFGILWFGRPARSLWQALLIAGSAGFGTAIGVHFFVGYEEFTHLAPAVLGAILFAGALAFTYRSMHVSV